MFPSTLDRPFGRPLDRLGAASYVERLSATPLGIVPQGAATGVIAMRADPELRSFVDAHSDNGSTFSPFR
jgi:hypothetical protein